MSDSASLHDFERNVKPHSRGCLRTLRQLTGYLSADLFRYEGRVDFLRFTKHYVFTPGFRYTFWMRAAGYLKTKPALKYSLYPFAKLYLLRLRYKFGIAIPEYTVIGPGLFINRFGGIYVVGDAEIGANVNITHGTVIGFMNRGPRAGAPKIGDRVFFGSGAKVLGGITVGDDAAVGANAVVTRDIPANGAVGGVPAKLLSGEGSHGYINRQVPLQRVMALRDSAQ